MGAPITDPARADEVRSRYAAIVESSHDAIISKDLNGVISTWNAAAERMFGYTEDEAIGRPIMMIIPPDRTHEEHGFLRRLRLGERVDNYDTVRVTKAGTRIDVSLTISPVRDATGTIVGCSKIARDITEAKLAQAAFRLSEQRLARELAGARTLQSISARLITESTPDALFEQILAAAMELMASDAASIQMLAPDRATLLLLKWKGFHPDSAAFWQRVTADAGSTGGKALADGERVLVPDVDACDFMAGTQDLREYRRSGVRAVQSTPLRSRGGQPLGVISTHWRTPHVPTEEDFTFFDVLDRLASDLIERTLTQDAIRESEARFRIIANTAPVMIWMSAPDKTITYVNPTWLAFTGLPLDTVLGRRWIALVHPDEAERSRAAYLKAVALQERYHMEHRLRRHDGMYRWMLTVGVPRYDVDGAFAGYIGTITDITTGKQAEEALSTVSQRLIEAHEEQTAHIARELHDDIGQRLVLASISLGKAHRSSLASAGDVAPAIAAVRNQLFDLGSDIQALSHGLHPARLELLGLEAAAAAFCQELARRHGIEIDMHFARIPQALSAHISLCLYRVLQEALQNVVKHAGSRRADVSFDGQGSSISLTVTDSGAGFDPSEAMTGPGLGLTSMRERLKIVGGQLSVRSESGKGTIVQALVPLPSSSAAAL